MLTLPCRDFFTFFFFHEYAAPKTGGLQPENHDFLNSGLHFRIFGVSIGYAVIADSKGYLPGVT